MTVICDKRDDTALRNVLHLKKIQHDRCKQKVNREGENLDQPVHILVLVCTDGPSIFHPADGGFGYPCGLTRQGGLDVYCYCHIVTALGYRRRD